MTEDGPVAPRMTIGDFSRATQLSAKALRYYHQAGVLEPASIDPVNGYRQYAVDQIADAQVVRHLRGLGVPVETVARILGSGDIPTRNGLLSAHLQRLEAELDDTRAAVAALRGLLTEPATPLAVVHRSVPAVPAVVIRETIGLADLGEWFADALAELRTAAGTPGLGAVGPRGGVWDTRLFVEERGEAVLFSPVATLAGVGALPGRLRPESLPAVDLAVAVHRGPDATTADTYAALGSYVARHEIGVDGPIRETYLREPLGAADVVTEIGWPVFRVGR